MCSCENDKYAGSITDNSVITCDEVIDVVAELYGKVAKSTSTKHVPTKTASTNLYVLFTFFINYYSIIDSC